MFPGDDDYCASCNGDESCIEYCKNVYYEPTQSARPSDLLAGMKPPMM